VLRSLDAVGRVWAATAETCVRTGANVRLAKRPSPQVFILADTDAHFRCHGVSLSTVKAVSRTRPITDCASLMTGAAPKVTAGTNPRPSTVALLCLLIEVGVIDTIDAFGRQRT
jgi:hypothetical protein